MICAFGNVGFAIQEFDRGAEQFIYLRYSNFAECFREFVGFEGTFQSDRSLDHAILIQMRIVCRWTWP